MNTKYLNNYKNNLCVTIKIDININKYKRLFIILIYGNKKYHTKIYYFKCN